MHNNKIMNKKKQNLYILLLPQQNTNNQLTLPSKIPLKCI